MSGCCSAGTGQSISGRDGEDEDEEEEEKRTREENRLGFLGLGFMTLEGPKERDGQRPVTAAATAMGFRGFNGELLTRRICNCYGPATSAYRRLSHVPKVVHQEEGPPGPPDEDWNNLEKRIFFQKCSYLFSKFYNIFLL